MLDSQPECPTCSSRSTSRCRWNPSASSNRSPCDPPIEKLTPFQTEMIALNLMGENQWHIEDLLAARLLRYRLHADRQGAFPYQIFSQRGNYSIVLRKLNTKIPTLEWLKLAGDHPNRFRAKRPAWCWSPARPVPANPRHWPRCSTRSIDTKAGPHHHSGRSGRIRSSARQGHVQSARTGHRFRQLLPTACAPPCARRPRSFWSAKCATATR